VTDPAHDPPVRVLPVRGSVGRVRASERAVLVDRRPDALAHELVCLGEQGLFIRLGFVVEQRSLIHHRTERRLQNVVVRRPVVQQSVVVQLLLTRRVRFLYRTESAPQRSAPHRAVHSPPCSVRGRRGGVTASTIYIDDSGDERRVVYSALVVPHEPLEAFQESVESVRVLCERLRGGLETVGRVRWHGVDLVRQRTRDPLYPDRPLPQHRLDFLYQEALYGLSEMPHIRVASVWADVGAVLQTGKKTRSQRRAKSAQAPPQGVHGTKVASLWHLLDLLDNELTGASEDTTSHRLILDGSNNQEDRLVVERYAAVRAATGFLSEPRLRHARGSRFLQLADLCAFGCFQNVQTTGGFLSTHSRAGEWYRTHLEAKWLPSARLHSQYGHEKVDVTAPDELTLEAWRECL
jgi:hypothetical protein